MIGNQGADVKAPYICIMVHSIEQLARIENDCKSIYNRCILKPLLSKDILDILVDAGLY